MYLSLRSGCLFARSTSMPSNALRPFEAGLGLHSNCGALGLIGAADVVAALASVSRSTIGVPTAARASEPMTTRRFATVVSFLVRMAAGALGHVGHGRTSIGEPLTVPIEMNRFGGVAPDDITRHRD